MKLHALIIISLFASLPAARAEEKIFEETFEGYPIGALPEEGTWPVNSRAPEQLQRWEIGRRSGPQAIISGSRADTIGQLYHFSESESSHLTTHSLIELPKAVESNAEWKLTLRFYVEALESPGVVTLISLHDGAPDSETARAQSRITSYALSRNSRSGEIQASMAREGESAFFRKTLSPHSWYTLEITGNNESRTFHATVYSDSFSDQLSDLPYATPTDKLSYLTLGDVTANQWIDGRRNDLFIDDLTVTQTTP